jgi:hypothetical protein
MDILEHLQKHLEEKYKPKPIKKVRKKKKDTISDNEEIEIQNTPIGITVSTAHNTFAVIYSQTVPIIHDSYKDAIKEIEDFLKNEGYNFN